MGENANVTTVDQGTAQLLPLGAQVRASVGRLYRRFRTERPPGVLGDAAFDVLSLLQKNGAQSLTELSDYAGIAPASMSQSVNRLTSAGYAVRTRDERDRRRVLFAATPEGMALAQETRAKRNAWLDGKLGALSADDQATIARACELLDAIVRS